MLQLAMLIGISSSGSLYCLYVGGGVCGFGSGCVLLYELEADVVQVDEEELEEEGVAIVSPELLAILLEVVAESPSNPRLHPLWRC